MLCLLQKDQWPGFPITIPLCFQTCGSSGESCCAVSTTEGSVARVSNDYFLIFQTCGSSGESCCAVSTTDGSVARVSNSYFYRQGLIPNNK